MKWFKNLKVMTKLLLSVAIMCSLMALLGYTGVRDIATINGMLSSLYHDETQGISHIKQANIDLVAHQRSMANLLLSNTSGERVQLRNEMNKLESDMLAEIDKSSPAVRSEKGKELLSEFPAAWKEYKDVTGGIIALASSADRSTAGGGSLGSSVESGRRAADKVSAIMSSIAGELEHSGQTAYYRSDSITGSSRTELLWMVIGAIAMGIVYGVFISRILSRPILALKDAAEKVAAGDTNASVEADSKDELGSLSASFNRMVQNIRTAMREVNEKSAAAEGAAREAQEAKITSEMQSTYLASSVESILSEMNKFADGDDDIAKLFAGFNRSVTNIKAMIRDLQDSIETTASAATEISSSTEQLAAGAQEQSAQANEVAAAVEEMTRTIIENSRNASQTAQAATESGKMAKESGGIVRETTNKMREIAEVVRGSAGTVTKLGESSKEISQIISVIDDIADQTNLLALNAAIEAARAGDQGKGFAVVADEVRKLAERTTQATKQIEQMIRAIQSETGEAVESMKKGTSEVEQGMVLANRAGEALELMVAEAQKSVDMINQIASASEEQSTTSEQISRNVESISSVSSESAAGVSQIARASDDLNRLTEKLRNLVSRFTVDAAHTLSEPAQSAAGGNSNGRRHARRNPVPEHA